MGKLKKIIKNWSFNRFEIVTNNLNKPWYEKQPEIFIIDTINTLFWFYHILKNIKDEDTIK